MQPRIIYPTRLSFRIEGEIKRFQNKQKLKEFVKLNLQGRPADWKPRQGFYAAGLRQS